MQECYSIKIVMLGYSEVNTEISDTGIKTTGFNDCKEISRDDRDTNDMLAVIWEKARFSYKDKQKLIHLSI